MRGQGIVDDIAKGMRALFSAAFECCEGLDSMWVGLRGGFMGGGREFGGRGGWFRCRLTSGAPARGWPVIKATKDGAEVQKGKEGTK